MKTRFTSCIIVLTTLLALALAGCVGDDQVTEMAEPTMVPGTGTTVEESDESAGEASAAPVDLGGELCSDLGSGTSMDFFTALTIAESSQCVMEGQLLETHFCNENSGAWWIDMAADKPDCNQACVVDVSAGSAEINWRCTGALPPDGGPVPTDEAPAPDGRREPAVFDYSAWGLYVNEELGYEVKYPPGVTPSWDGEENAVTFEGALVDDEHWPVFFVGHGAAAFYRPPEGVTVREWVESNSGQPESSFSEVTQIAGLDAYHLVLDHTRQSYASDQYYFIKEGQMFSIVILHTGNKQDWRLYEQFLQSFTFLQPDEPVAGGADVAGWLGVIGINPVGSQSRYFFDRQDGQRWILGAGDETLWPAIAEAAWNGAQLQLDGFETPTPGLINVTGLAIVGDPPFEARNLSAFARPSASSALPSDRLGTYQAWSAVDGRPETPWCEGAQGPGTGQWLELLFESPLEVTRIRLASGYSYDDDIYAKNNRVKRATFLFTDGQRLEWEFDDTAGWQEVPLARAPGPNMTITGVTIIIDEVYLGSVYDDTCIGEVEIWGRAQ